MDSRGAAARRSASRVASNSCVSRSGSAENLISSRLYRPLLAVHKAVHTECGRDASERERVPAVDRVRLTRDPRAERTGEVRHQAGNLLGLVLAADDVAAERLLHPLHLLVGGLAAVGGGSVHRAD